MPIPLDLPTLRIIWWVLLGFLLIAFAVTDGFDFGVGMLLHRVAKTDEERRVVLNTVAPVWEGNQIWFILSGGMIFAAWPEIYAVSFSGFYFAMLLILFALILRPVGFKYRSKITNPRWRAFWDFCLFIGGFVPALIFGVAVGNVLQGVPFHYDDNLQSYYTGTLIQLLNPFALLCGALSVVMFIMHGGIYLAIKTTHFIQYRATKYASVGAILTLVIFALGGLWIAQGISGYVLSSPVAWDGPSNPLHKKVITQMSAWLTNYSTYPMFKLAPLCGLIAPIIALILVKLKFYRTALVASALSIGGIIATVGLSMFPFILPSSEQPNMSLLLWDASSTRTSLFIMLIAAIVFIPLILFYTTWIYYVMRGKVTPEYIRDNQKSSY